MNKRLYIDCETTGVFPDKNAVIQIAGVVVIDGVEREEFNLRAAPFAGQIIEDGALKVNGRTREEIASYPAPVLTYRELIGIITKYVNRFDKGDKFHFVAYNSPFDNQFIREFFTRSGDKYFGSYFWTPDLCIMRQAAQVLNRERHLLKDFKLGTVAEYLGIHTADLHDAMADIRIAMLIEKALAYREAMQGLKDARMYALDMRRLDLDFGANESADENERIAKFFDEIIASTEKTATTERSLA
jgi:DNA polymerase III subunit epsilon